MKIQIHTGHNIESHEALATHFTGVVEESLSQFGDRLTNVDVHLSDENSDKKDGHDNMRCMIEARLTGHQPLAASHQAETLDHAVDGAAEKLAHVIEHTLGRLEHEASHRTDPPLSQMNTKIGLWIDQNKATIVTVTEQGEKISEILADAEKQLQRTGDSPLKGSYEALQVPADYSRQKVLTAELNTYYDEIIRYIRDASSILIVGPGVAKHELQKRLEKNHIGAKIVGVETVDNLTEPQLVAMIRQHFAN
ncbi:HPF/RaiA family ribosome-associated protein [Synechocystis sp. FACHB-383]|nr:HPF/RaiA family ribosome-associated protein [Synechocystis sp. FACHB-383]